MSFGERLKELRTDRHLTQEELANQLYVTRQTISNWENGKGQPELENIILISEVFQVSIDQLLKQKALPEKGRSKNDLGRRSAIVLSVWSLIMLAVQLILHPYSMIYVFIYVLGGTVIVTDYLRRTKRLANLYGQGENMYDLGIVLWAFFAMAVVVVALLQSSLVSGSGGV